MVTKEEKVLFPMALESAHRRRVGRDPPRRGRDRLRVRRRPDRLADRRRRPAPPPRRRSTPSAHPRPNLALKTGELTLARLNQALNLLPLDFSIVDENDRVLYYSEGERIFPRSPGVIGRKVQNCHPPASVDKVQQIVDAFRAGDKDVAEFWLEIAGKFLHIRYLALRDDDGAYRGVLETVQDVTAIRALEGQRRLLDW